jgi:uncharacterized tellurite resistance protein B-like protein
MPHESRAADLIGYSFLVMFAKDGVINAEELHFLEHIALSDGEVDDEERAALRHIFSRADYAHMEPAVCAEIEAFRARYAV